MPNTINGALDWWAANRADVIAIKAGDDQVTYADLRGWTVRAAAFLQALGLGAGDRLCIQGGNSIDYMVTMLATMRIGAIAIPMNPRLHPRERDDLIGDFEPRILAVESMGRSDGSAPAMQILTLDRIGELRAGGDMDGPQAADEDAIVGIISTSGSTSRPKGVMYSNRTVVSCAAQLLMQEPFCGEGARVLVYPSISTSAGFLPVFQLLIFGGTTYLGGVFDPETALRLIGEERITMMMGSTIFFDQMAAMPAFESTDVSSLRVALTGGAPVAVGLLELWKNKGAVLRQIYGQTECSGTATMQSAEESCRHPDKCGRGGPYTDIAILRADGTMASRGEAGEILLRGPTIMVGYWNAPDATAAAMHDGWLRTGDVGILDETGNLSFIDRLKDVIRSGGYQISAAELERVIGEIPGVESVAVISVAHDKFGETPLAVVHGRDGLSIAEIIEHCSNSVARYKIPRYVVIEEEPLPRLATGKIAKAAVREKYKDAHKALEQVR